MFQKADSFRHGTFLYFVECGIVQKMQSPKKEEFQFLKKAQIQFKSQVEISLFRHKYGLSTLWTIPKNSKLFH